jgi:PIN domain nuclease of toxin-antitoxin system
MKVLLDTHILLWWLSDNDRLSLKARELISNPENDIFVSHVSLWEIQIKVMTGKLQVDLSRLITQLPKNNFI